MTETTPAEITAEARIAKALGFAKNGVYDGAHHKDWVIDQMVRALTGCPMVTLDAIDARGEPYSYDEQGNPRRTCGSSTTIPAGTKGSRHD